MKPKKLYYESQIGFRALNYSETNIDIKKFFTDTRYTPMFELELKKTFDAYVLDIELNSFVYITEFHQQPNNIFSWGVEISKDKPLVMITNLQVIIVLSPEITQKHFLYLTDDPIPKTKQKEIIQYLIGKLQI